MESRGCLSKLLDDEITAAKSLLPEPTTLAQMSHKVEVDSATHGRVRVVFQIREHTRLSTGMTYFWHPVHAEPV